jgi:hypothetical protein
VLFGKARSLGTAASRSTTVVAGANRRGLISARRQLDAHALPEGLDGKSSHTLANRLRVTRAEAARRIREAADLGPRRAVNGETLEPKLAATATGQRQRDRRRACERDPGVPHHLPVRGRRKPIGRRPERWLTEFSARFRPDELERLAERLALVLNPDGIFFEGPRPQARIAVGPRGLDEISSCFRLTQSGAALRPRR